MIGTPKIDHFLGVSAGSNNSPYEGLPMQVKSLSRNKNDRFYNVAFGLDGRIYSLANKTLGVGRGMRLTSNLTRIVVWNQTDTGKLQWGTNCLTVMECNTPETDSHCDPDSPFPVREPDQLRRGAYVKLYPCTGQLYGQRWFVLSVNVTAPTVSPTLMPTLRHPSVSPSSSPFVAPTIGTEAPTDIPSVEPTGQPTWVPTTWEPTTATPTMVVVLSTVEPTLQPTQLSGLSSNVEAPPLYAIPVAIGLFILAVILGRILWNDPKKRCF